MSIGTCRASMATPFTSMIQTSGFRLATSARWNSGEKGLIRSRSRTCLALLPIVLFATPNASLSWSAVTQGSLAGSDRKLAWPRAYTIPAAHVALRPPTSGDGRLRASFAAARRARSAYSSSRTAKHAASVRPTISSTTGRSAFGTFSSRLSVTATSHSALAAGVRRGSAPHRLPPSARPPPLLRWHHSLGPLPAKPLEIQLLDELRQRRFPWFLAVIGDLAELPRVQPEFAAYLHLRMRQLVPRACLNPSLRRRRKRAPVLSHTAQPTQQRSASIH